MKNVLVSTSKSHEWGFLLNESELRRLVESMEEQMDKILQREEYKIDFKVLFSNGIVAKTEDVDEVLTQENSGSLEIVRLSIDTELIDEDDDEKEEVDRRYDDYRIFVRFENVDSDESDNKYSVYYYVKGKSRDWVMITSSIIEERVSKVRTRKIELSTILSVFFFILFLLGVVYSYFGFDSTSYDEMVSKMTEVVSKSNDNNTSLLEALIEVEKIKMEKDIAIDNKAFSIVLALVFLGLGVISFSSDLQYRINKVYSNYNFYWGDYITEFDKNRNFYNKIVWGGIIALLLSIAGGMIANYVGSIQ